MPRSAIAAVVLQDDECDEINDDQSLTLGPFTDVGERWSEIESPQPWLQGCGLLREAQIGRTVHCRPDSMKWRN